MSDYSKITNFLSKDSLALNDPAKYVKGSEIDAEYNAIAVAIATKADTASPTLVTPNIGAATGTSLVLSGLATVNGAFTSLGLDDNATATALTLSGSGANSVTIANSATNPTIGTSAGALNLSAGGVQGLVINPNATANTYAQFVLPASGGNYAALVGLGSGADVGMFISSKGTGAVSFYTNNLTNVQAAVLHTASADRYITLTGSNGGNPTIGTSAGSLAISSQYSFFGTGVANYIQLQGNTTTNAVSVLASGSDTNIGLRVASKGSYSIVLSTNESVPQVAITHTASADRYITLTGSNGGNPTIGTSAGNLAISTPVVIAGTAGINTTQAIVAGGVVGLYMGAVSMGVYFGSGAPTITAAKGSIYLRSDGTTTNNRMYVNTDGGTTWTAVTTAA